MNFWDLDARLGYMRLISLASSMTHEERRYEEVKRVTEKEEKELLYIRVELVSISEIINNHGLIFNDVILCLSTFPNRDKPSYTLKTHSICWEQKTCKLSKG